MSKGPLFVFCHGLLGQQATRDPRGELVLSGGVVTTGDLQLLASSGDTANGGTPQLAALYVCNSGVGHATAESVLGPTWALLWAGVPCVVSCNWEAWSGAAAKHAEFLAESLTDGNNVATAMQSAALKLGALEGFSAPHYWACFTCQGYPYMQLK